MARGVVTGGWHVFPLALSPSTWNSWHSHGPDHEPGEWVCVGELAEWVAGPKPERSVCVSLPSCAPCSLFTWLASPEQEPVGGRSECPLLAQLMDHY